MGSRLALAMICGGNGYPEEAMRAYGEMVAADPKCPSGQVAATNLCFSQTLTFQTTQQLCEARRKWYEHNRVQDSAKWVHTNDKNPDRVLRVGYVGGDFKRHSASMIFGNVVLNHGPDVELYLYSSLPVDPVADAMSGRFKAAAGERWRDISAMTDDDACKLIHKDKIDILVDLAAHTGGGRLGVFCRKPAPVQCTGWGFAHGTGVPEIDYFLADPIVVPESERGYFAEKIIDLPCAVTYLEPKEYGHKPSSSLPAFKNDYVTFGCYVRYEKLSDECLRAFGEILAAVPGSKLEFKDHAFRRPSAIRRVLEETGAGRDRLLFSISTDHPNHMLAYQQCDLALNPFPHSSGVVCLETLYMGVPLVTLRGGQPGGRTAASVLAAMGRGGWVADTMEEYVRIAAALVQDLPQLQRVRKTLRQELLDSPVMRGYPQAVEAAYREVWRRWCGQ
jgi:predicted O-linked N-acetylglucosamine transferase (SPINDLY family)